MELRALKALLGALKTAGVTSYRDESLSIEFGAALPPMPTGDIEGADQLLPDGVFDPRKRLKEIQDTYAPKPKQKAKAA